MDSNAEQRVTLGKREQDERITTLIRKFSIDAVAREPDSDLAQCLMIEETVKKEQEELQASRRFRHLYEDPKGLSSNGHSDIDVECRTLTVAYEDFLQAVKADEQEEKGKKKKLFSSRLERHSASVRTSRLLGKKLVDSASNEWDLKAKLGRPPTFQDIEQVVKDAETEWKGKDRLLHGKAQRGFHSFCRSLGGHSTMLQMIPSQNNYTASFCGAITTLVKASTNHEAIAVGFAKALDEISTHHCLMSKVLKLHNTAAVREVISNLYASIFELLRGAFDWFKSKWLSKVLHSVNENFFTEYADSIIKIKDLSAMVFRITEMQTQAEVRDTRLDVERITKEQAKAQAREKKSNRYLKNQLKALRENFDKLMQITAVGREYGKALRCSVNSWPLEETRDGIGRSVSEDSRQAKARFKAERAGKSAKRTYSKNDLQRWSRTLEYCTSDPLDTLYTIDTTALIADQDILDQISLWSQSTHSYSLWVHGLYEDRYPSTASAIASKVVEVSRDLQLNVIYHFCSLPSFDPEEAYDWEEEEDPQSVRQSHEEAAVIDLLYSLIRQLLTVLPDKIPASAKLSQARFAELDGSPSTFEFALLIFRQLLKHLPRMLIIVIDGIEKLDELVEDAENPVMQILASLQESCPPHSGEDQGAERDDEATDLRLLKILYTTAGPCEVLESLRSDYRERMATVEANKVNAYRAKGLARKGTMHVDWDRLRLDDLDDSYA